MSCAYLEKTDVLAMAPNQPPNQRVADSRYVSDHTSTRPLSAQLEFTNQAREVVIASCTMADKRVDILSTAEFVAPIASEYAGASDRTLKVTSLLFRQKLYAATFLCGWCIVYPFDQSTS